MKAASPENGRGRFQSVCPLVIRLSSVFSSVEQRRLVQHKKWSVGRVGQWRADSHWTADQWSAEWRVFEVGGRKTLRIWCRNRGSLANDKRQRSQQRYADCKPVLYKILTSVAKTWPRQPVYKNRLMDRLLFLSSKSRQVSLNRLFSRTFVRQKGRIGLRAGTGPVTGYQDEQGFPCPV